MRARWDEFQLMRAALAASPFPFRLIVGGVLLLLIWSTVNWTYHAIHKPTELFFPLDDSLDKNPADTWRQYQPLFVEHSTAVISPEFLAALAQLESGGNPVARTYWRWRLTWNPFGVYRPASSAVGLYQITDGTFQEAKRYCIHEHHVAEEGPWHDLRSCWFNGLYMRVLPSHAIEMTAALLDRRVAQSLGPRRLAAVSLRKKQELAAVIHLCGAGAGREFVTRGFRLASRQRCGDHEVRRYVARVTILMREFAKLAAGTAARSAPSAMASSASRNRTSLVPEPTA
ncbi:MAG: transglycosylase SLT domain-containing protein [Nitrospira sp.]|nr:transglycosylase SLT domain-containing protein [Nitrospira sp.]